MDKYAEKTDLKRAEKYFLRLFFEEKTCILNAFLIAKRNLKMFFMTSSGGEKIKKIKKIFELRGEKNAVCSLDFYVYTSV